MASSADFSRMDFLGSADLSRVDGKISRRQPSGLQARLTSAERISSLADLSRVDNRSADSSRVVARYHIADLSQVDFKQSRPHPGY